MKKIIIMLVALMTLTGATAKTKNKKKVDPVEAKLQQQQKEFEAANKELCAQMESLNEAFQNATTEAQQDSLRKLGETIYPKYQAAVNDYMKANPSTAFTAMFLTTELEGMSTDEIKAAFAKLDEDVKTSQYGKEIQKVITARENLQPGKPAPMIAKNDIDGKPFSLADCKGNPVILDFWATWCVPCRASNPHMMRIYDKYHAKGLQMVYIADDDGNVEKLRKAIEKDGVGREGIRHILRGLVTLKDEKGQFAGYDNTNDLDDLYDVHSIPTKFLIDKDGNLVGRVESEKWLDNQLSLIYNGKENRDFHIDGHLDNAEGDTLHLSYDDGTERGKQIQAIVKDGKFQFDGTLGSSVCQAALFLGNSPYFTRDTKYCRFYIEPSESKLTLKMDDFRHPELEGSDAQDEYVKFEETVKADNDKIDELNKQYDAETDKDKKQALHEAMEPYQENIKKTEVEYIKNNPTSALTPDFLYWNMSSMPFADLQKAYASMTDEAKASNTGKRIKEEMDKQAKVQPGADAYMIKKQDVMTGKMVDMEKMRGKYIIVDFWASWCVPCRKSNPHMLELYNRYHKKGLEFVYVGDNDSNPDQLKQAIEKDGLKKMHHVLRGIKIDRSNGTIDRTNDISDQYGIHFLPTKYLVDKEGKIVGKFESEELDAKLKEIFGE